MEARDAEAEDPFTLPWEKGLKSYWAKINTWSVDGMPGLKQSAVRVTTTDIQKSMEEVGIKVRPPLRVTRSKLQEMFTLVVGLLLGMFIMQVRQRQIHTILADIHV
jgi:hypothetical protein